MSQVQQVKDATDIVEIIGTRVDLKRSGANYRGLCPFHSEKSPSFFVTQTLQRYRCFGCGESGDVLEFLQRYDGLTFYESLQVLAEKAAITLTSYTKTPEDTLREELLAVLDLSRQYYHWLLTEHEAGEKAREYLRERGITKDSVDLFQMGYSLPGWDGLLTYLTKKKHVKPEVIEKAGLVIASRRGHYDRFRGRIMFPLKDTRGRVVGFSGRTLEASVKEAKYINSPETLLYHKSKMLYGYSELFSFMRQEKRVTVVEGEFDVISSVQAHVNAVVALKGSALTQEHAKILARTAETIVLSLDTDQAGVEATRKAIEALRPYQLELRVVVVGTGKDPDELARKDPKGWREAVKQSMSAYDFLIKAAAARHDPATPEGKRNIMKDIGPVLATVVHGVELEYYIKALAELLGVQREVVRADIARYQERRANAPLAGQDRRHDERADDPKKLVDDHTGQTRSRRLVLEEYLLFLLFHASHVQMTGWAGDILETDLELEVPGARALLEKLLKSQSVDLQRFSQSLSQDQQQLLFELHANPTYLTLYSDSTLEVEFKKTLGDWKQEATRNVVEHLSGRLSELDAKLTKTVDEDAEQDELLRRIVKLRSVVG